MHNVYVINAFMVIPGVLLHCRLSTNVVRWTSSFHLGSQKCLCTLQPLYLYLLHSTARHPESAIQYSRHCCWVVTPRAYRKGQHARDVGWTIQSGEHPALEGALVDVGDIVSLSSGQEICKHQSFKISFVFFQFLPRCTECRRGLAMRIRHVCLSVCLSKRELWLNGRKSVQISIAYEKEHLT